MSKATKIIRLKGPDWFMQERAPAKDIAIRPSRRGLSSRYYSVQQLATRLGVHLDLIYRAIKTGELAAQPVGRIYRIGEEEVQDYLLRMRLKRGVI